jgi:hypothetical protein
MMGGTIGRRFAEDFLARSVLLGGGKCVCDWCFGGDRASFCMHGIGLRVVAAPENDGTQEKWELKRNENAAAAEMVGVIVGEWGRRWRKEEGGDLWKIFLLVRSSGQLYRGGWLGIS